MMARRAPANPSKLRFTLPTDFDARATLRNQRRRLRTQELRLAKETAARARIELASANTSTYFDERVRHAVANATASLVRTVSASFGLGVTVDVEFHDGPARASTDFTHIRLLLPADDLPDLEHEFDPEPVRRLVALVKGLGYHEVGHLRFTTPFSHLVRLAIPNPRRSPIEMPLPPEAPLRECWAILEDQRMEAALVAESPNMANYLTAYVLRHITARIDDLRRIDTMWFAFAGRHYLPEAVRADLRNELLDQYGPAIVKEAESIVASYLHATDAVTMLQAVVRLYHVRRRLSESDGSSATSSHIPEPLTERTPGPDAAERLANSAAPPRADAPERPDHSPGGDVSDTSDTDDEATPDDPTPNDSAHREPAPSEPTPSDPGGADAPPSLAGVHHAALAEAEAACIADGSLDDTVRSIYEDCAAYSSSLPPASELRVQTGELADDAERTAHAIAAALRPFTAACAPTWQVQQPHGVIDSFAYRTRMPGSRDFHRSYRGLDDIGLDIAVSLLLDVSGSMFGNEALLASSAFACKRACEYLDIPCTVTLFASTSALLWSAEDRATHVVPHTDGGTDPTDAAKALGEQRYGKRHHLVVVLTDGAFFDSFPGFARFAEDGRYFLGLALDAPLRPLRESQVHEALAITSVTELPNLLTTFLTAYLR